MLRTDEFDYELPERLIAAEPAEARDRSRLMVLDRRTGSLEHMRFFDLPDLLRKGDVLVLNDARVLPARFRARRVTGGSVEVLLIPPQGGRAAGDRPWVALVRGGGRLREGEELLLEGTDRRLRMVQRLGGGRWLVSPSADESLWEAGRMPLPPYVLKARRRRGMPEALPELDEERYQTVYARAPGAVAAPTAGLHFTEELLGRIRGLGVEVRTLSLLVGPGTFRPVRAQNVGDHRMEAEFFDLPGETARAVERAKRQGRRVIATGTTSCRVLEHVACQGRWCEQRGWTELYIYPPFEFRAVDALITNFHLPRSTLLMLVSAFAGRQNVLNAYREAVRLGYRFYSYGDAMFIR